MPHYIVPPLQSVTEVGATTDQETTLTGTTKLLLRDSALYIHSPSDGQLKLNADVQLQQTITAATGTGLVISVTGSGGGRLGQSLSSSYTTISGGSVTGAQGLSVGVTWASSDSSSSTIYGLAASPTVQGGTHANIQGFTFGGTFAAVFSAVSVTDFRAINIPSSGFSPGAGCTVTDYHSAYISAAAPASTNTVTNYYGTRYVTPGAYTGTLSNATHLEIQDLGSYGGTSNKELFITGAGEAFFRDANTRIGSSTSGQLDLYANTTVKINTAQLALENYAFPLADGSLNQVLQTDGAGTVSWATVSGGGGTPGGSSTQIQYNNAGAFGGIGNFTTDGTNLTLAGGYFQFNSSVPIRLGTGNLSSIQHNGTNLQITATTGNVTIAPATGSQITLAGLTLVADNGNIGLDGTTPAANQFIKCDSSGSARGCLNFKYNFTGGTVAVNCISDVTNSTSITAPKSYFGDLTQAVNNASTVTGVVYDSELGFSNSITFSSGTYNFSCFRAQHANGTGTVSNSGGTFNLYGLKVEAFSNMKGSATTNRWGINSAEPIQVLNNTRLYFGGTATTFGTAIMVWNTTTSALETSVGNNGVIVTQTTVGNRVQTLQSTATNDDPLEVTQQNRVATTDATVTTLDTFTIPASTTVVIATTVTARRTGGSAGTAEDGAGYGFSTTIKNVAGTATIIGGPTAIWTHESQAGWDATHDVTGATVRVRVTGAVNNNVTWHSTSKIYYLSS